MTALANINRPATNEYHEYYESYVSKFTAENFFDGFEAQIGELRNLLGGLSEEETSCLHEPYTWNLKQVVGHLIDCERIFSTRALRIAVADESPIPGIDQDIYVANLDYDQVTMASLLDEFASLRMGNLSFAKRLKEDNLNRIGVASGNPVSARGNLFIIAGHFVYHFEIMKKRLAG
jgi:hypothetical protein